MAQISFEGYVNERRGKMLRVSEEYRAKDESGQWGNAGYGNFTVWLRDDDAQPELQAGAVVLVAGDLRVKESEKDGRRYTNLNVSFAKVGLVRTTKNYQGGQQSGAGGPQNSSGYSSQQAQSKPAWAQDNGAQGYEDTVPF